MAIDETHKQQRFEEALTRSAFRIALSVYLDTGITVSSSMEDFFRTIIVDELAASTKGTHGGA